MPCNKVLCISCLSSTYSSCILLVRLTSEKFSYMYMLFVPLWYIKASNSNLMLYKMNTMQKVCSEVGLKGAFCHSRCDDHHVTKLQGHEST